MLLYSLDYATIRNTILAGLFSVIKSKEKCVRNKTKVFRSFPLSLLEFRRNSNNIAYFFLRDVEKIKFLYWRILREHIPLESEPKLKYFF